MVEHHIFVLEMLNTIIYLVVSSLVAWSHHTHRAVGVKLRKISGEAITRVLQFLLLLRIIHIKH